MLQRVIGGELHRIGRERVSGHLGVRVGEHGVLHGVLLHAAQPAGGMHKLVAANLEFAAVVHVFLEDGLDRHRDAVFAHGVVRALDAVVEQPIDFLAEAGVDHLHHQVGALGIRASGDGEHAAHAIGNGDDLFTVFIGEGQDVAEFHFGHGFHQRVVPRCGRPVAHAGHHGLAAGDLLVDGVGRVHRPIHVDQAFGVQLVHEGEVFFHAGVAQVALRLAVFIDGDGIAQAEAGSDFRMEAFVTRERDQACLLLDVHQQLIELVHRVRLSPAILVENVLAVADVRGKRGVVYVRHAVNVPVGGRAVGPADFLDVGLDVRVLLEQIIQRHERALPQ